MNGAGNAESGLHSAWQRLQGRPLAQWPALAQVLVALRLRAASLCLPAQPLLRLLLHPECLLWVKAIRSSALCASCPLSESIAFWW